MLAANDSDAAQDSTAPQTLTPDLPPMAKAPPQVEETPGPGKTLLLIVGGLLALALTAAGLMFALNGFLADLRRRRRAHRRHFHREDDLTATTPR